MNTQTLAWIFAAVFILIGILGFIPGLTEDGYLLGVFEVDALHNIIHLLSGVLAGAAAIVSAAYARLYFKAFGVIYAVVALLGLVQNSVLGLIYVNTADNILHLVIAASAVWIGFVMKSEMSHVQVETTPAQTLM